MGGLATAGAILAGTWFALGLVPPTIAVPQRPQPASAVVFVPHAMSPSEEVFFDLGTDTHVGAGLIASQGHIMHLEHGWSIPEDWGIWALGETAAMRVFFDQPQDRTMLIRGWAPKHPDRRRRQTVTVWVNGHEVGTTRISRRPRNRYISIPSRVQRSGENLIDFDFAFSSAPAAGGFGGDTRALAVGFCSIGFVEGKERLKPPSLRSELLAAIQQWFGEDLPAADLDGQTGTLVARQAGRIVAPISGPEHARSLTLRVRAPGNPEPRSSIRSMTLIPINSVTPNQLTLGRPRHSSSDDQSVFEISIPPEMVGPALLELEIDPGPWTTSLQSPLFRRPTSVLQNDDGVGTTAPSPIPVRPEDQPDLIVITLDAARPDHFGCYGYDRPTTPNIDRLARESAVFERAFALAPYTLCSVPTMITGTSFLEHGVVARGQSLSPDATTLAEHLDRLGYENGCFSATPNNSRSLGFDQGYATFWEAWQRVNEYEARDPERLSAAVLDWLATVDEEQPIHLQVHYVPPHEPYDPGPAFDIFGDPSYSGVIDGTLATIKAIDSGHHVPTQKDLDRLTSLYDGNLRRGDAAVGVLLQALQDRRRWSNTIVLVTSDHGEAFLEHGRLGHNSTVFDEMLRIPFILRLPARFAAPLRAGLVTVADILPTFISAAGGVVPSQGMGADLLSVSTRTPGRGFFIARTDRTALRFPRARPRRRSRWSQRHRTTTRWIPRPRWAPYCALRP